MSSIAISGDTSGAVTITAPAIAGTNTMTLVAGTGSLAPRVLSTAVASTSGTAIDFTNIPSWVTRITIMFNGVSTSGSSAVITQLGSGSVVTTGYNSKGTGIQGTGLNTANSTTGFLEADSGGAAFVRWGNIFLCNVTGNAWTYSSVMGCDNATNNRTHLGGGAITLSGVLDRIRITTAAGTDTFDAGTINIMYE